MKKDPVRLLGQCKNIYLKKSEKETGYSVEDVIETYNIGVKMLYRLKLLRDDKQRTIRYLKVKSNRNCYKCDVSLLETWLIQSMVEDDTYLYAYNYLSQKANRQEGFNMFRIKLLSDFELFDLLENEASDPSNYIGKEELEKSILNKESQYQKNRIYKGNDYALAFILDCFAKNENPIAYYGSKKNLEQLGNSIMGKGRGNTFYKCFNLIVHQVCEACKNHNGDSFLNKISYLVRNDDWQDSVLKISKNRLLLEHYLREKSKEK